MLPDAFAKLMDERRCGASVDTPRKLIPAPARTMQVTKLVAALQGQVLHCRAGGSGRRPHRDALSAGQQPPALLLRVAVPGGGYGVKVEDAAPVATFLQWHLVCKAMLRALAGAPLPVVMSRSSF